MTKQTNFFDYHKIKKAKRKYGRTTHGGMKSKGHRKEQRPLFTNKWTHLVLKSEHAKGAWSFLTAKNQIFIQKLLKEKANTWGIQIAEIVNMGNHLHIKLKFSYKEGFRSFLKAITGMIARHITKARKGHRLSTPFWQGLAFTRVIRSAYEELQLKGYFKANREEATKGYEAREAFLKKFNRWAYDLRARNTKTSLHLSHNPK